MTEAFKRLCEIEPGLRKLYDEMKMTRGDRRKTAEWIFYHRVKPRLQSLVGFSAEKKSLQNCESWDLAYKTLYDLLHSTRKNPRAKAN